MNRRVFDFIFLKQCRINTENRKKLRNAHPVDGAKTEKFMNAGDGACILQPGEPIVGNKEFWIALHVGDALALIFDLAHGYAEPEAKLLKAVA